MKYLRRYNEVRMFSYEDVVIKSTTGYTVDELKDIFKLNLEDNGKFDLSGIDIYVTRVQEHVHVALAEYFGDNYDFSNMNSEAVRRILLDLNIKMLEKIARKYNLHFWNWSDWGSLTNHSIEFNIRKL